jgi:threonine dehydrogenase-like Zn-dependent dehydrogenase
VVEIPIPTPLDDEVLVEVKLCATCTQWDITTWTGVDIFERPGYPRYPMPPGATGHELAGIVVKAGKDVDSLKAGDRVALWDTTPRAGTEVEPGGFAEYFAGRAGRFVTYPEAFPFERAALTELLTCLTAALFKVGEVAGKRVGVSGLGPAGLMAVQALKARGAAEVIAFDIAQERIDLALALGADQGIVPESEAWEQLLPRERNLDIAIDCIGVARSVNNLIRVTRDHLVIFGVPHGDIRFTMDAWFKDLKIESCGPRSEVGASYARHLLTSGQVNVDGFIGAILPLERYGEGVGMLIDKQVVKVGFDPKVTA